MSVKRPRSMLLALVVYGLLLCVGVALVYFELRGTLSMVGGEVLPLVYVLIIVLLARRGAFLPRGQDGQPPRWGIELKIKIQDIVKSVICFVAAVLWGGIAASMTSDTPAGHAVVVVPSLVIAVIGAFFLRRGFFLKGIRR